jgi:hypothetical protein
MLPLRVPHVMRIYLTSAARQPTSSSANTSEPSSLGISRERDQHCEKRGEGQRPALGGAALLLDQWRGRPRTHHHWCRRRSAPPASQSSIKCALAANLIWRACTYVMAIRFEQLCCAYLSFPAFRGVRRDVVGRGPGILAFWYP